MLEVKNLKKHYGKLEVLNNINLTVGHREIVGLVGPSGCGKTTALNIISGHDRDYSGSVENNFNKISYVFQEDRLLPWCTIWENIKVVNDNIQDHDIFHLLEIMELADFYKNLPRELSGGMRQRVSIARAFAYKADLMLMDEPFKSLDQKLKENLLLSLIKLFDETDLSILIVTHDHTEAAILCDKIVLLTARPASIISILENPGDKYKRLNNHDELNARIREIKKIIHEQGEL